MKCGAVALREKSHGSSLFYKIKYFEMLKINGLKIKIQKMSKNIEWNKEEILWRSHLIFQPKETKFFFCVLAYQICSLQKYLKHKRMH